MSDINAQEPRSGPPLSLVHTEDDDIDLEAMDLLKTFCLDPLSERTGMLIDQFAARRCKRATLRIVK